MTQLLFKLFKPTRKATALSLLLVVMSSVQVSHAEERPGAEEHFTARFCAGCLPSIRAGENALVARYANDSVLVAQADGEPNQADESAATQADAEPNQADESATAGEPTESQEREDRVHRRVALALAIGAAYWPNAHKVEPNPTIFDPDAIGRPNAWGISIELAGHARIYHYNRWDVFLGADLGFINLENEKSFDTPGTTAGTEKSRLLTQMIYITPSMKLYYHTDTVRPFIGLGAGGYFLEMAARTEKGSLVEKFVDKEAFGGYASIGIDIPMKFFLLRIEDKLHMADFGSLGIFAPNSGRLTGPINMIQVGIGLTF